MSAALALVRQLAENRRLDQADYRTLLASQDQDAWETLWMLAQKTRERVFGKDIYVRGLIEFTNHCQNDCYYCGIRHGNRKASRYRLTGADILACCDAGYRCGLRTFVLQGGDDPFFTDDRLTRLVRAVHDAYADCAVTLSVGERSAESYRRLFDAGASRYLLRHETANDAHYQTLHPPDMRLANRKHCLQVLRDIGYQVGCGMMVGSPGQTLSCLAEDLVFIGDLQPHMVGIGPFIPHRDTPLGGAPAGSLALTLRLLAIVRLMLPEALLPATTALAALDPAGRAQGLSAGANVLMPNLTPADARARYALYDGKPNADKESAEAFAALRQEVEGLGYTLAVSRGDHPGFGPERSPIDERI